MPDGENSGVAGGNGATEMTSRESFLSTGVGVSLALLLLRGATARVDEPVADLVQGQACKSAKVHLLVFGGVGGRAVCSEPFFQDVGSLLGEIAAALAVEGIVINTDMLLEPDIVVGLFVSSGRWGSVRWVCVID